MLHKNAVNPTTSAPATPGQNALGLTLVPAPQRWQAVQPPSSLLDLAVITARRCSAFFAEAAVLVLVFGILDFFILKGRIDLGWIVGALAISLSLLAASIAMDFSAHRWIKVHP
jgi:hypothetical protein